MNRILGFLIMQTALILGVVVGGTAAVGVHLAMGREGDTAVSVVTGRATGVEAWGQSKLSRIASWDAGEIGRIHRDFVPRWFAGVPHEAFMGFCANGGPNEDTVSPTNSQPFHETGLYGIENGLRNRPAPDPDPSRPYARWAQRYNRPTVVAALGRPATLVEGEWKRFPDQIAVGLENTRDHGRSVMERIPANLRAQSESSLWFVACCFGGWSAGDPGFSHHINRVSGDLNVPETDRWGAFLRAVSKLAPGNPHSHGNASYSALRTAQKLAAGRLLAEKNHDPNVAWFNEGLGNDRPSILAAIEARANGRTA